MHVCLLNQSSKQNHPTNHPPQLDEVRVSKENAKLRGDPARIRKQGDIVDNAVAKLRNRSEIQQKELGPTGPTTVALEEEVGERTEAARLVTNMLREALCLHSRYYTPRVFMYSHAATPHHPQLYNHTCVRAEAAASSVRRSRTGRTV